MRRLLPVIAAVAFAGLVLAGCSSGADSSSSSNSAPTTANTIDIKNFAFAPVMLSVAAGAKVTVKNEDTATHTVTSTDKKSFDTGNVAAGASTTFTAPTKPGTYTYICDIHQYMQGTLTVK